MPGDRGTVYVYGVLAEAERREVSVAGVEGAEVRTVGHGGLAALVSDLEAEALTAAKEVRSHWRVLEEASAGATVLPVRFGTVMESDDAVREQLLEPNAEGLTSLLRELRGRVQLSVKADYEQEQLLRGVVAQSPQVAALREGLKGLPDEAGYYDRIRLGELVSSEIERRREEDRTLALDRLEPLAVSAREESVSGAEGAFNLAFLVERDRVDPFSAAVQDLADETGERLRIAMSARCRRTASLTWAHRRRGRMGLISALLTLPLAPVRGTVWIAERVEEQAESELYDESAIRAGLLELEVARETGARRAGDRRGRGHADRAADGDSRPRGGGGSWRSRVTMGGCPRTS